jgi:N-methylhydantoinase B
LGFARDYRILADEVRFSLRTDKHQIAPWGTADGADGEKAACVINPESEAERRLPSRFGDYRLNKNDILRLERPGGGGLGDPFTRPVEMVLEDVRQGYVSADRALTDYGVAARWSAGDAVVNGEETDRLRGRLQKNSGKHS